MTSSVTNRTAVRPGFGKIPDRPSFDKKSLAAKKTGSSGTAVSTSTLKNSATQGVATATKSTVFQTRAKGQTSGPFVAGTHNMGVNDFYRNRTNTTPHGFYAAQGGKFQLESDMGMTRRATNRLLDNAYGNQQAQIQYLNQMSGCSHTHKMSTRDFISGLVTMFTGLVTEFGGKSDKTQTAKTVISSNPDVAAMQNAKTSEELSTAISTAQGKLSNIGTSLTSAQDELKKLKDGLGELKQNATNTAQALKDNKTQISQKQSEVQNNINRESASKMAMSAAQAQVDMLKSQLSSASPIAKAGIEASLRQAEEQLKLKTEQYEQAVKDRAASQEQLQELNNQTAGLEQAANTAQKNLDVQNETISIKEKDVNTLKQQQKELTDGIQSGEQRLETLKKKDGDGDKKA